MLDFRTCLIWALLWALLAGCSGGTSSYPVDAADGFADNDGIDQSNDDAMVSDLASDQDGSAYPDFGADHSTEAYENDDTDEDLDDGGSDLDDGDSAIHDAADIEQDGNNPCSSYTPPAGTPGVLLTFDELNDDALVTDRYASRGVLFSTTQPAGPRTYGLFGSPVSEPNYLVGEREDPDTNPSTEYGNNRPALPIELTFVDSRDPRCPGTTSSLTLQVVYPNQGNITRLDAYALDGSLITTQTVVVDPQSFAAPLLVQAPSGIHRAVVIFDGTGTGGTFEDNAGIDNIQFAPVRAPGM